MEERVKPATQLNEILPAWKGLRKSAPYFGPIRNERDYARMQSLMEQLLEEVGDDENHLLSDLLDVVGVLVGEYEDENTPGLESSNPKDVLKFLMEQQGLKQSDLRKEIGSQGVVSEILSGARKLNARQAKALARRFGVSPLAFL